MYIKLIVYFLTTENSSLSRLPSLSMSERFHTFPRTSMGSLDESMKGLALSPESNPLVGIKLYNERQHIYYTEGGGVRTASIIVFTKFRSGDYFNPT